MRSPPGLVATPRLSSAAGASGESRGRGRRACPALLATAGASAGSRAVAAPRERERERERGEWAAAFRPPRHRETRRSSGSPHGRRRQCGAGEGGWVLAVLVASGDAVGG